MRIASKLRSGVVAISCAAVAACASSGTEGVAPASIEVVYVPEKMVYAITQSGPAYIIGATPGRDLHFHSDEADFNQIATLLEPLKADGLSCSSPSEHVRPGHIIWRQGGVEVHRAEMHTICYADASRPLAQNADTAWRLMEQWGKERYVAPVMPASEGIRIEHRYWGNLLAAWQVAANGRASRLAEGAEEAFPIAPEQFTQLRKVFQDYKSRHFECNRIVADLPYGYVIWLSKDGSELQRTRFDEGCISGDASDLFEKLQKAEELLDDWREERQGAAP